MTETVAEETTAEQGGVENYEHRIKCMNCGLHYSVFSYDEDWAAQREGGSCPECGVRGKKIAWGPVTMTDANGGQFIFMRVPGGSVDGQAVPMSGMWIEETRATFGVGNGPREEQPDE